jgi:hypothetical protein
MDIGLRGRRVAGGVVVHENDRAVYQIEHTTIFAAGDSVGVVDRGL